MRRKFKRIAAAAMATAMALSVAACGGSKKDSDKIILGYMGPLTGESALWGEVESNTLKMLVEETNANGGIIGKQIELKIYDNRGDAVETTNAARKALQNDGVVAFIGPDSSSGAIALAEVCEEYKVPHITTTGTNYKVTQREEDGSVRPYAFRICLSDPQLGDIMGGYAKDKLGYQKVAILYEISSEYSLGITQNFTNSFEAKGGQVTITEAYKTGDVDFRAQLSKIKEKGDFDALMIPANYKEVGLIAKQARSLGIEVPFLGVDAWMMQDLFEIAKDEVQDAVFPCAMDVNDESLQEFKNALPGKVEHGPGQGRHGRVPGVRLFRTGQVRHRDGGRGGSPEDSGRHGKRQGRAVSDQRDLHGPADPQPRPHRVHFPDSGNRFCKTRRVPHGITVTVQTAGKLTGLFRSRR